MKNKKTVGKVKMKRNIKPLSFIKNTPVLPVVTKKNVKEILELLEDLTEEQRFYLDQDIDN